MPNRTLNQQELDRANGLLQTIRAELEKLSDGDGELLFAFRRKVVKELGYDERSKPMVRRALKRKMHKKQNGICALCHGALPERYSVLDRFKAVDGYVGRTSASSAQTATPKFNKSADTPDQHLRLACILVVGRR
jgi:UTP:GlnB (protein PII) uridylyltransferase